MAEAARSVTAASIIVVVVVIIVRASVSPRERQRGCPSQQRKQQ
jgi:hypothetical protein